MGYIIIKNYYCGVTFWPHKASYFMTGLTAGLTKGNKKTVNRFDDQRAWFCERVNENSGGLYWLAKSILHNDEDVKDAVQETVLTAYEKLGSLRDEGSFKPWIMRILANTAYSMIRRSKPNTDIDSLAEELPAPQNEDREESMALWQAVRGLGESLRTVTVLFYYDDMPIKDISRALGITEGTVKARLSRARAKLRSAMSEQEETL